MNNTYSLRNFIPLIIIFLIIIILTILKQFFSDGWNISSASHDFMGIFFIIFAIFKIMNLNKFADAYSMYDLIAQRSRNYALAYPFIELGLGILFLLRWHLILANGLTLVLMLISAAGVARALSQNRNIQCACLGAVFKIPMTYVTLAEDLLMAFMAIMMLLCHSC